MTFLEIVNEVQRSLRESVTMNTYASEYSTLLAMFVNKAKRMVEDAYDWPELRTELSITTANGTSSYSLTGSGKRFRVIRDEYDRPYIYNTTTQYQLNKVVDAAKLRYWQGTSNTTNNSPEYVGFEGVDSSGDLKVLLYPTPSATEVIKFYGVVPQGDLNVLSGADDAVQIKAPEQLIVLLAWAFAIAERGEDQSFETAEPYALYREALNDAISYHDNFAGDEHKDLQVL